MKGDGKRTGSGAVDDAAAVAVPNQRGGHGEKGAVDRRGVLAGRAGLVARNALSVLASDAANRATTFALYALVARNLGPHAFGQMSLALTFFYASQVVAVAGLKTLVTREVARRPDRVRAYLRGGVVVVAIASLASLAGLSLLVALLRYSGDTAAVILLLALGLIPYSLSQVFEAIFQAFERMALIAYANVGVNAVKIVVALALLSRGRGLVALITLLVVAHALVAAIEFVLLLRRVPRPPVQHESGFARRLARAGRPFLGMEGLVAVMSGGNIVLLSKLATEREVGLYNAAAQLMVPIGLVIGSAVLSVFPHMCARYDSDPHALERTTRLLLRILLAFVVPAAVGLFFVADDVLLLLYAEAGFGEAASVLRLMVANIVLMSLTAELGQVLLAGGRERTNLRITAVDAVASVVLGLALIGQYGLLGAAVAALLVKLIDFAFHYILVSRVLSRLALGRLLWKPALASALMAGTLMLLADQHLALMIPAAVATYGAALVWLERPLGWSR